MDFPRRKAKTVRPFLTTAELLESAHVTRKTLRGAEESGFIEAAFVDDTDYYKYWSIDQLDKLRLFGLLRTGDVSRKDIAEAAEGDTSDFLEMTYHESVKQMRILRRTMRALSLHQGQLDGFNKSSDIQGAYVGYLPTRWLALIPACTPQDTSGEITAERFTDCLLELRRIIEVVGWAPSFTQGILTCYDSSDNPTARFVFIELACPSGISMYGRAMDCGCYRAFDPDGSKCGCSSHACHVCARFGRTPTDAEAARWDKAVGDYPWRIDAHDERNIRDIEFWEAYVQEGLPLRARRKISHEPGVQNTYEATTIARACLMPQNVMLPLGVTACALPAGMYITEYFDRRFNDVDRHAYLKELNSLPRRKTTQELHTFEVHERPKRYKKKHYGEPDVQGANQGPFAEPFVATHHIEDPAWSNFHREISEQNRHAVHLVTGAGLVPKAGYCVIERLTPDNLGAEMSAFVDLDDTFFK